MNQKPKAMPSIPPKQAIQHIEMIEAAPTSSGKRFLLIHLQGDVLTRDQASKAKCADCCGYYIDGRLDCGVPGCPLYKFMPYRGNINGRKG